MIRYRARWVLPISRPPIAAGVVAVEGERIAYVGTAEGAPAGEDVDLGNVLLMPGLVNAHCHLELTGMRGFLEELDFGDWILRLATAKRAVLTSLDMLIDAARLGIAEGLRAGVTTYGDTCHSGAVVDALRECGVRGIMYQEVFGPDPAQCSGSMAELREQVAAARALETPLVRVGVSPHAPYTVSGPLLELVTDYALAEDLPVMIHAAESLAEAEFMRDGRGPFAKGLARRGIAWRAPRVSTVQYLNTLGVLSARPLLAHCVRVGEEDLATIGEWGARVAHCPKSNAKLGHGRAPFAAFLRSEIALGFGSDSVASNNTCDMLEEARFATLMARAAGGVPGPGGQLAGARDALRVATQGGAEALGL
ncbi:MAG: amidohydrolase family protein, partial [Gemmatimonadaceae bacterium]